MVLKHCDVVLYSIYVAVGNVHFALAVNEYSSDMAVGEWTWTVTVMMNCELQHFL